ncbi:hypothetical protein D3C75_1370700 [compost metagenome]
MLFSKGAKAQQIQIEKRGRKMPAISPMDDEAVINSLHRLQTLVEGQLDRDVEQL